MYVIPSPKTPLFVLDPNARVPADTASVAGTEGEPAEEDFPEISLDELLDEMTLDDKDAQPDDDDTDLPDDPLPEDGAME